MMHPIGLREQRLRHRRVIRAMGNDWLPIHVVLLSGRGQSLPNPPARTIVVGPEHTFADLAEAINIAFGRWDLAPRHCFGLADGRMIGERRADCQIGTAMLLESADVPVIDAVATDEIGESFTYVFDLERIWHHACLPLAPVSPPLTAVGDLPSAPLVEDGWGSLPDQYGHRTPGGDAVVTSSGY